MATQTNVLIPRSAIGSQWTPLRFPVSTGDTLMTGEQANRALAQVNADNGLDALNATNGVQVAYTGGAGGIRILAYGTAATAKTATMYLMGWRSLESPASFIGEVALETSANVSRNKDHASPGWLTQSTLDSRILEKFDQTVDWFACDTYTDSPDPGGALIGVGPTGPSTEEYPGYLELDFSRTQYQYVLAQFANVGGGGAQMARCGALFVPLAYKGGMMGTEGSR